MPLKLPCEAAVRDAGSLRTLALPSQRGPVARPGCGFQAGAGSVGPSQTRGCRGCETPRFGRGLFSGVSETPAGRAVPQQMLGRLLGGRTWILAEQELCYVCPLLGDHFIWGTN